MNDVYFLDRDSDELKRAWGIIKNYDSDLGIPDPMTAKDENDEAWQYMGTEYKDHLNGLAHVFRHRNHPAIRERVYLSIKAAPKQ